MVADNKIFVFMFLAVAGLIYVNRERVMSAVTGWKSAPNADKYLPTLNAAERRHGIPPDLLARMAYQESRFRDDIVSGRLSSPAGALGIMQIMPKWHPGVNPLDVPAAIDYAARYVKGLRNKLGSWKLAVAAYNAGPGNVQKYDGIPPFPETQAYVHNVFNDLIASASPSQRALYA